MACSDVLADKLQPRFLRKIVSKKSLVYGRLAIVKFTCQFEALSA